jgi:ribonuclease HI
LWLPENGQSNKIKINRERYLKYTVTDLNNPNETFTTAVNSIEMQGMNTFFVNFMTEISSITNPEQEFEVTAYTQTSTLSSTPNIVDDEQIWSLYFDGSKSWEGTGVGCVLIDPMGKKTFISCQLEFECTNNTAEYKALLQGLRKALDLDVQKLVVFGDSGIIVKQVRNEIHCLSPHFKSYQTEVWGLMHKYISFNINSTPRSSNSEADFLANVASKLLPIEGLSPNAFSVELLFRPSIPDNITNWQVFDDDQ